MNYPQFQVRSSKEFSSPTLQSRKETLKGFISFYQVLIFTSLLKFLKHRLLMCNSLLIMF